MNVLIVDDQKDVVRGLRNGVNWKRFSFGEVFEAYSGMQAIDILKRETVELVITDIDMPHVTGLDLAAWIEHERPQTVVFFLTAHADFGYAQRAIQLGCFDYIVQPVDYRKLEESIGRAIDYLAEKQRNQALLEKSQRWLEGGDEQQENFWLKLLTCSTAPSFLELEKESQAAGVEVNWETKYQILHIAFPGESPYSKKRLNGEELAVEAYIRDAVAQRLPLICRLKLSRANTTYILEACDAREAILALIAQVRQRFHGEIACFLSQAEEIFDLRACRKRIDALVESVDADEGGLFCAEETPLDDKPAILDAELWRATLTQEPPERIRERIRLETEKKSWSDQEHLGALAQTIFDTWCKLSYERQHGKTQVDWDILKKLWSAADSRESFADFLDTLLQENERARELSAGESDKALVERVKAYIGQNLESPLSRQEIAQQVYVSKDYLSHLFREKEGVGLVDYINQRRIDTARELLAQTEMPLMEAAAKVGIANYSYFCRLFKRQTGVAPLEYRLELQRGADREP